MITQDVVVEKILAHLNHQMTEAELVHWAEDALVIVTESDVDIPNEDTLLDVLGYLGAGDTPGFPLSWSVLSDFLGRFGVRVQVITTAA
jgi:hypothetical protein